MAVIKPRNTNAREKSSRVIQEYADEVAWQLKMQIRSKSEAMSVVERLPSPELLVQQVLGQQVVAAEPHQCAVSDGELVWFS